MSSETDKIFDPLFKVIEDLKGEIASLKTKNTCKTCKHWNQPNESYKETCEDSHRLCSHVKLDMCHEEDGLHSDNDGYYWLTTGPNFGCIHWEKKV